MESTHPTEQHLTFIPLLPEYSGKTIRLEIEPCTSLASPRATFSEAMILTKSNYFVKAIPDYIINYVLAAIVIVFSLAIFRVIFIPVL